MENESRKASALDALNLLAGALQGAKSSDANGIGDVAKAVSATKFLEPDKLASLTSGLLNLAQGAKTNNASVANQIQLAPLLTVLQSVQGTLAQSQNAQAAQNAQSTAQAAPQSAQGTASATAQNVAAQSAQTTTVAAQSNQVQKLWDTLRPFLGNAASLSGLVSMLGSNGGPLLDLLKKMFLHA